MSLKPLTHDQLQSDLFRKRSKAKAMVAWSEIAIPGTGGGRFDVYAIRSHAARKTDTFIGYEVKATLADLESDLSTGKWERYLPACDEFWFALGPELAEHVDRIPEGPGVQVLVGSDQYRMRWTHKRKPVLTGHRTSSDVDIWKALALRDFWNPTPVGNERTRLERMREYESMKSLSHLLSDRFRDEVHRIRMEVAAERREVEQIDRKRQQLEDLESRLDGVPVLLNRLGLMLSTSADRVGQPRVFQQTEDRQAVDRIVDQLLELES